MSAPDYATAFDIEAPVENAIKSLLFSQGVRGYTQREIADQIVPRVDIQVRLGDLTGHQSIVLGNRAVYSAWNATLTLQIVTHRDEGEVDPHGQMRGKVRFLMQYFAGKFTETILPYHSVEMLRETGTLPTVSNEDDCDYSAITFAMVVAVRPSAWPVANLS